MRVRTVCASPAPASKRQLLSSASIVMQTGFSPRTNRPAQILPVGSPTTPERPAGSTPPSSSEISPDKDRSSTAGPSIRCGAPSAPSKVASMRLPNPLRTKARRNPRCAAAWSKTFNEILVRRYAHAGHAPSVDLQDRRLRHVCSPLREGKNSDVRVSRSTKRLKPTLSRRIALTPAGPTMHRSSTG